MAQSVTNLPVMQEARGPSLGQEEPLEKGMAIHSSICLENSMDRGAGCSPWGLQELDMTEQLIFSIFYLASKVLVLGIHL